MFSNTPVCCAVKGRDGQVSENIDHLDVVGATADTGVLAIDNAHDANAADHLVKNEMGFVRVPFPGSTEEVPRVPEVALGCPEAEHDSLTRGIHISELLSNTGLQTLWNLWLQGVDGVSGKLIQRLHHTSRPVASVDIFLSHTWRTTGWLKALQLQLRWCAAPAVLVLLAAQFVIGGMQVFEYFPRPSRGWCMLLAFGHREEDLIPGRLAPWNHALSVFLGGVTLLVFPCFPKLWWRNPLVFLDAVCICQHDDRLKRLGIGNLETMPVQSSELHVLWSPAYMKRLWCVYKLAAFTQQSKSAAVHFNPVFVEPLLLLVGLVNWICIGIYMVESDLLRLPILVKVGGQGVSMLPHIISLHVARLAFRESRAIVEQLSSFDAETADCKVAADREHVLGRISAWHGSTGRFNEYVRSELRSQVARNTFQERLPYSVLVLPTALMSFGYQIDLLVAFFHAGVSADRLLQLFIETTVVVWVIYPFMLRLLFDVAAYAQQRPARGGLLADLAVTLAWSAVLVFVAEVSTDSMWLVRTHGLGLQWTTALALLWAIVSMTIIFKPPVIRWLLTAFGCRTSSTRISASKAQSCCEEAEEAAPTAKVIGAQPAQEYFARLTEV
eukprot:TRINITY_DN92908_c0_g1_i1.p1 TRINITY_DN92908_c0_g1~~TRINITY_DN92908_c0_g1_i1.p1  ORF type:complete len:612 (-),score=87.13 TRINITY_DN92908_c0_g1_i1:80-1915(-)